MCTYKLVLQLGAGTAIPGLTAAKCGAHVTFSNREDSPHFHDNIQKSCELNGIDEMEAVEITWGVLPPKLLTLPPQDVIIASDCFYDSKGNIFLYLGCEFMFPLFCFYRF